MVSSDSSFYDNIEEEKMPERIRQQRQQTQKKIDGYSSNQMQEMLGLKGQGTRDYINDSDNFLQGENSANDISHDSRFTPEVKQQRQDNLYDVIK